MPEPETTSGGLRGTASRLAGSLLALLQNRLQILSVELQEEKCRAASLLLWLGAALAVATVGLGLAVLTLAVLAWKVGELTGLIVLTALVILTALLLFRQFRLRLKQGPPPFAATIAEFKKDREWVQGKH